MSNEVKYRIAQRCPDGLPKQHRGKDWLMIINDDKTDTFLEGLVFYELKVCALVYLKGIGVYAKPLEGFPCPALEQYLTREDRALLGTYLGQYAEGKYQDRKAEEVKF